MKVFKTIYFSVFLLSLLLPATVLATVLRTADGKYYQNYSITKVTWNKVEVCHDGGIIWLDHKELPVQIQLKYSKEIEKQKKLYVHRVSPIIKNKIAEILQVKDHQAAIDLLEQLKLQYPDHPMLKEAAAVIRKKRQAISLEKAITDAVSKADLEAQISALQQLIDDNPEAAETDKIKKILETKKQQQQKLIGQIENAIKDAEAQENFEKSIAALANVLKQYPNYPIASQQEDYSNRVNQLITDKHAQQNNRLQKIEDRQKELLRRYPDFKSELQKAFLHQEETDLELAEKIFQASMKMADAINRSKQQSTGQAIETLKKHLTDSEFALNKNEAIQLKAKLEDQLRLEAERNARLAAVMQIKVTEGSNGQFVIKKELNKYYDWYVLLVHKSQADKAHEVSRLYSAARGHLGLRNHYNKVAKNVWHEPGNVWLGADHCKSEEAKAKANANEASDKFFKARDQADELFAELQKESREKIKLQNPECSFSNINDSVIILAFETFSWQKDNSIYSADKEEVITNCWYIQYTPGKSENATTLLYGTERYK